MATFPDAPTSYGNGRPNGAAAGGHGAGAGVGPLLDQMTLEIQARIAEVERRHSEALHDMQAKLERLSGDAERARPAMPPALASAFSRIEAGMADLVDRIAETVPERRRGAEAFVFGEAKADHSHFVFNTPPRMPVAPVTFDGAPTGEHWDPDQVDALARLYESGEADIAKHLPEAALFAPGQWARDAARSASQPPAGLATTVAPEPLAMPAMQIQTGDDRVWAEQRFAAIADHISETVRGARPDSALETLMTRVDQFETRFTTALDDLAAKADLAKLRPDALQKIEAQLLELSGHVETAHQRLSRLDVIEQHLADLTAFAHASMETNEAEPQNAVHASLTQHDFAQLAELAVDRALARVPAVGAVADPAEAPARSGELHALLAEFAAERRRGDEQTNGMLETVQEALIRLIDRIDAIDAGMNGAQVHAVQVRPQQAEIPAGASAPRPDIPAPPQPADASPAGAAVDDSGLKTNRRRERRVMLPAQDAQPINAAIADTSENPAQRPAINIRDLRIDLDRVGAVAGASAAASGTQAEAVAPPAGRVPRLKVDKAQADAGGAGRRGIMVAAAALSAVGAVVGASYFASQLFTDRYSGQVPANTATVLPPPITAPQMGVPKAVTAAPAKAVARPAPQAAGATLPPGMVGAPGRADVTQPTGLMPPVSAAQPVAPAAVQAAPNGNVKPGVAQPQPGTPDLEFTPTRPVSMPETATDDLSQADINIQNDPIEDKRAVALAGLPASIAAPLQPMQGMAVAQVSEKLQAGEVAAAQRQASMAAASERMGFQARPAETFSQRFGAATPAAIAAQPKPSARALAGPSPIVTGSAPAAPLQPVSINQANAEASPAETVPGNGEMPPGIVGPISLRLAAQKGDPSATFEVATRFAEGRGPKQDYNQAMAWYQRSAAKGFAVAQYRLGTLYERGLGTTVDLARAKLWYKRSAEQGNVKAMHNLAVLSAGNGQAAPDYATAAKWFGQAAEYGLPDSQFNLGVLYENGLGVAKDPGIAYVWYSMAARNGDQEATRRRDRLLGTLEIAVLKDADDKVRGWHGRVADNKINDARVAGDLWRNRTAQVEELPASPAASPIALLSRQQPN